MGHLFGYNSQEYENQIRILDKQIKKIISIIENLWDNENLKILITTDHGSIENKHGGSIKQETGVFLAIGLMQNYQLLNNNILFNTSHLKK